MYDVSLCWCFPGPAAWEDVMSQTESWLPSLRTATPEAGYELAVKLGRMAVKLTQPSAEVRGELRPDYDHSSAQLIAVAQVVATNFQTIAAANDYWRGESGAAR
jgi:hypothetical protein